MRFKYYKYFIGKEISIQLKFLAVLFKKKIKYLFKMVKRDVFLKECDHFFMKEALKEAEKAYKKNEVPVGAVLVYQNKIISRGYNQVETLKDATAHAEMICLRSGTAFFGNWRLADCTLYSTVEPCVMCAGAMIASRIKRLVWGTEDYRVGANGSWIDLFEKKHPIHEIVLSKHVLKEPCSFILKDFFQKLRKK